MIIYLGGRDPPPVDAVTPPPLGSDVCPLPSRLQSSNCSAAVSSGRPLALTPQPSRSHHLPGPGGGARVPGHPAVGAKCRLRARLIETNLFVTRSAEVYTHSVLYTLSVQHDFNGPEHPGARIPATTPSTTYIYKAYAKYFSNIICMSGCTTLVNMALGGTGHTHTQTRFSNFGPKCGALNGHQPQ